MSYKFSDYENNSGFLRINVRKEEVFLGRRNKPDIIDTDDDPLINIQDFFDFSDKTVLRSRSDKKRILDLLLFFSKEISETIKSFYKRKEFSAFDPHVGDALCQVRAYKLLLIARESHTWKNRLLNLSDAFHDMVFRKASDFQKACESTSEFDTFLDKRESLSEFIRSNALHFDLPGTLFFLVESRILTRFSQVDCLGVSRSIDYSMFSKIVSVSKSAAKKITRNYQRNLSQESKSFIAHMLSELTGFSELKRVFDLFLLVDKDKREVFPCYEVTKIILNHALIRGVPIEIFVERIEAGLPAVRLLFAPNQARTEFVFCENFELWVSKQVLKVSGFVCLADGEREDDLSFAARFLKLGVYRVILANMANHPQYAAPEFGRASENPYLFCEAYPSIVQDVASLEREFLSMKQLGEEVGCSRANPSLFSIRHIFFETFD